jgi:hypothetical protein
VTAGDVDIQVIETSVEVVNTTGNPVPVAVQSGTINMTATNVGVSNTSANPVPVSIVSEPGQPFLVTPTQASTVAENAALGIAATVGALIAAGTRRAFRVRNAGTGVLAIGGNAALTVATAAIVLNPGDVWEETLIPQAAWYAISDVGTTAAVEVIT